MADNQDTVRPQDLGSVGHLLLRASRRFAPGARRLAPRAGLALGLVCAAVALPGSAFSQDIGLRRGEASLSAGQFDEAARQLSATVNDPDATINQVAQALYLRGIAYRRAGYPGQAAADLGAALWLGLPSSDTARAYVNKGLAYQAAGMSSQAESAMAQARRHSSASTVDKLAAQDGGVGPVATGGVASLIPSVPSIPSPGEVWENVVPSFGAPKTAAQTEGEAAPAENTSVWNKIVPSFGAASPSAQSATAPAGEGASTAAATPQAAPTSGWDASVKEGSGGNAVTRWWDSVAGGGAPAVQTAPAPAPAQAAQSAPPKNSSTTAARSSTASTAAAQPQAAPTSGWDASVSEGEGGSGVKQWWNSVTGGGQ